jgi:hypothetical protein
MSELWTIGDAAAPIPYKVVDYVRRTPWLRGVVYVVGSDALLQFIRHRYPADADWADPARYVTFAPLAIVWTRQFARLRVEDQARWATVVNPPPHALHASVTGMAGGAGAFLLIMGVAAAKGWVRVPAWGWQVVTVPQLVRGILLTTSMHLAIVVAEEIVFRGYGFDTVMLTGSKPVGLSALILWFAVGHAFNWQVVVGESALGLALTSLRWYSDALWLPMGYHFGWNIIQTAAFGPPDGFPSLRPLHVHGPQRWIGKPGHPVPGLLMTLVNLVVAIVVVVLGHRKRRFRTMNN